MRFKMLGLATLALTLTLANKALREACASDELPPPPLQATVTPQTSAPDLSAMMATIDETNEDLSADTEPLSPEVALALTDARQEYLKILRERATSDTTQAQQPTQSTSSPETPDRNAASRDAAGAGEEVALKELLSEVDALKSKLVVEQASYLSLQSPRRVRVTGAKTVFNYLDTAVYEVTSAVDHVTDIQLKPGETLTTPPTSGDTVRWSVGVMKSGAAPLETTHLIIKPLDNDIETNLIIATDEHVYQLRLKSGDFHMPVVAWNYPQDSQLAMQEALKREASHEVTITPEALRFSYDIEPDGRYAWTPLRVFDDGKKTFIQMPKDMQTSDAPALFLLDEGSEPLLTNYRVKGDYYIVDRLLERAQLQVGPSKKVTIELSKPNWFERNFF